MESCLKFLPHKSYNIFGMIVQALFFLFVGLPLILVALIGLTGLVNEKTDLRCNLDKNVGIQKSHINETACSLKYNQKYNSPVPINKFVILNVGLVFALTIIYAVSVNNRIEFWDKLTTRTTTIETTITYDVEGQRLIQETSQLNQEDVVKPRIPVFFIYIFHLVFARSLPMILFFVLVFYPAFLPTTFSCSLPTPSSTNSNMTDLIKKHSFTINCTKPRRLSLVVVSIVDIMFGLIALFELIYLVWVYWIDKDFASDLEFCSVYLLRKRKRIRKIIKNYRNKLDKDKDVLQLDIRTGRKRKIDDMYVVIQEGRERRNRGQGLKRHEIYETYLKLPEKSILIEKIEHVFLPSNNNKQLPRKILVVGRPGIGKTVLIKKILHRWKTGAHDFYTEKLLILLSFRTFNKEQNKTTTLKEMLRLGAGLPDGYDFDGFYQYILSYPERVILILDGLDELKVDGDNCDDQDITNHYNQTMSMFSVFKKLICNNFLPGATVVTTSRPTAEHIYSELPFNRQVEILGFTEKEIQNYVEKFCQRDNLSSIIWNKIQESAELLSLCYIPVSCYIICLTLKYCIEHEGSESGGCKDLPRTMTGIYKRAIRIILWEHEPEYKEKTSKRDFLTSELPEKLQDIVNKLKPEATSGMGKAKLIFECKTEDKLHAMKDCGLLTSQPRDDEYYYYYCFLHLTIQEFLAAWQLVDNIKELDVENFLSNHIKDPNWHLVIQFFAGLLGDEFRENKLSKEIMDKICQSFAEWISFHNCSNETWQVTLLTIKCLCEIQESDILKSAANKVDGGGNDGCSLKNLNIAPVDCAALFQFLRHVKHLLKLDFSGNNVGDHGFLELVRFLHENNQLLELDLCYNNIGDKGVEHLCNALKNENCKLTNLNLERNEISDEGVEHLCNSLNNENCKLTNLNLEGNKISDKGAEHLGNALKNENCKLTNLDLCGNEISDTVVEHLCNALKNENCKLTYLDLWGNKISDKGVEHLCNALKNENCKLTNLNLEVNKISDKGAEHLCNALKNENCKLTNLNLTSNKTSDKGAEQLRDAGKRNHVNVVI